MDKSEVIELDEAATKAIAEEVRKGMNVEEAVTSAVEKAVGDIVAKFDKVEKKDTNTEVESTNDVIAKGVTEGLFTQKQVEETKEVRLLKGLRALLNGDGMAMKSYNALSFARRDKAGYQNTVTDADGGYLVPDPEFDTTIYENLPKYGVAMQYADVSMIDRTSTYVFSHSGLSSGFANLSEAGAIPGRKLTVSRTLKELNKYGLIVTGTNELDQDAAVDFWNLVTQEVTRQQAYTLDDMAFTNATTGITNTSGVITHAVSGAGTTLTWNDLLTAEGKLEDAVDTSNFAWYMRRETWFALNRQRADAVTASDGKGVYLFQPNPNAPTTPWGTPVRFTRVLLKASEVGANDGFAVYCDLRDYKIRMKRGLQVTRLTEATVTDSNSSNYNLATQDGSALRFIFRALGYLPEGIATKFVVIGTGTVS